MRSGFVTNSILTLDLVNYHGIAYLLRRIASYSLRCTVSIMGMYYFERRNVCISTIGKEGENRLDYTESAGK